MTIGQLYRYGKEILSKASDIDYGIYSQDVELILQSLTSLNRAEIITYSDKEVDKKTEIDFIKKINLRAKAYPLQYILEKWEFMGIELKLGEGVLIPREDTYCCVEAVLEKFQENEKLKILDLCAGTGAISLALSAALPRCDITAVELYDEAYKYLCENIKLNNKQNNIKAIKADVRQNLELNHASFDVIISNPPYIPCGELKNLQKEVCYEPKEALDGGEDGLNFYRDILSKHLILLKDKSYVVFEFGDKQENKLIKLMKSYSLRNINIKYDFGNNPRAIIAIKE